METAGETMPKRSTLKLTKRIVEKLKAEDKDAIYWDGELAGFGVRVHATGRKLFIVQSRGPAGLKRATLGPVGAETIEKYRIGIGGHLTMPPLPHHRAYGSVPRRFDRIRPQQGCRVWGGRASRNGGCVGPAGPPHVRPCASTPSASQRRWRLGPLRVPGGGAP